MRWNLTPSDIHMEAEELMKKTKAVYDSVAILTPEQLDYENVIRVKKF